DRRRPRGGPEPARRPRPALRLARRERGPRERRLHDRAAQPQGVDVHARGEDVDRSARHLRHLGLQAGLGVLARSDHPRRPRRAHHGEQRPLPQRQRATAPGSQADLSVAMVGSEGASSPLPKLAYVFEPTSFATLALYEAASGLCELLWVVDASRPEVRELSRLLARLGTIVDIGGLSLDAAAVAIANHEPQ